MSPRRLLAALGFAALLGCGPKSPPASAADAASAGIPDTPPALGPSAAFLPPVPAAQRTPAGHPVWVLPRTDLPLVSLRIVVPGGSVTDPAEHPGLTSLADAMLLRGAGELDAAAFTAEADRRAIQLRSWTARRATVLEADFTADQLDAALGLLATAVLDPRFDSAATERLLDQRRTELRESLDDPRSVASTLGWTLWFGADHPYGHPTSGTVDGIEGITAPRLAESWAQRRAGGLHFVAVGDVDGDALQSAIDRHFEESPAATGALALPSPGAGVAGGRPGRFFVDQPGASQTVLRVTLPAPAVNDPRVAPMQLGAFVLGGSFTSRLNRVLREEQGYTYGARAWPQHGPDYGMLVASTNVFVDQTGPALADLVRLIDEARAGIDADELRKAQSGSRTESIETAASRSSLADELVRAMLDGLPPDAAARSARTLAATDETTVDAMLAEIDLNKAQIIVVGDIESIRPAVEEAVPGGWTVLDKLGRPTEGSP